MFDEPGDLCYSSIMNRRNAVLVLDSLTMSGTKEDGMASRAVTIQLPGRLWQRLKYVAQASHRSVQDVLTAGITATLPAIADLPANLADELAAMTWLSDQALWGATTPTFAPEQQARLAALNELANRRDLTVGEQAETETLLAAYHRSVLCRAQAFALLAQRGHRMPALNELPLPPFPNQDR
jgi:hypothetical protein